MTIHGTIRDAIDSWLENVRIRDRHRRDFLKLMKHNERKAPNARIAVTKRTSEIRKADQDFAYHQVRMMRRRAGAES